MTGNDEDFPLGGQLGREDGSGGDGLRSRAPKRSLQTKKGKFAIAQVQAEATGAPVRAIVMTQCV